MKVKDTMKTYRIENEDRYGRFNDYDLQAQSLEAATATAEKRVNLPHGAFVTSIKEVATKVEKPWSPREFWQARGN